MAKKIVESKKHIGTSQLKKGDVVIVKAIFDKLKVGFVREVYEESDMFGIEYEGAVVVHDCKNAVYICSEDEYINFFNK